MALQRLLKGDFVSLAHADPHRIQMHKIAHCFQIARAAPIHDQRLVTSAEQMPEPFVPPVKPRRIRTQKPLHARHQVRPRRFHDQMKMIAHQTIGMHLPTGLPTRLARYLRTAANGEVRDNVWVRPLAEAVKPGAFQLQEPKRCGPDDRVSDIFKEWGDPPTRWDGLPILVLRSGSA